MKKDKIWQRYGLMLQKYNIPVMVFVSKLNKKLKSKLRIY